MLAAIIVWVSIANVFELRSLAWPVLILIMLGGCVFVERYCAAHEDEIPPRKRQQANRHG